MKLKDLAIGLIPLLVFFSSCSNDDSLVDPNTQGSKYCAQNAEFNSANHSCRVKAGKEIIKGLVCAPDIVSDSPVSNLDLSELIAYDQKLDVCEYPAGTFDSSCAIVGSPGAAGEVLPLNLIDVPPDTISCDVVFPEPGDDGGLICTADANEYGFPSHCECFQLGAPNIESVYNPKMGKCELRSVGDQ